MNTSFKVTNNGQQTTDNVRGSSVVGGQYILGISCFYHDAAAAIIRDGVLVAAAAQERFSRKKHDSGFPSLAIEFCLKQAGIHINQVSCVVFYEKPLLKFERILTSFVRSWPFEYPLFREAFVAWVSGKLWIKSLILQKLKYKGPVYFSNHHMSHAASAFFVSPFEHAAILTIDGVGEWATTTISKGQGNHIQSLKEIRYPNSLGLFYSAVTYFLGFAPNSDEYKVMGLAPYGRTEYLDRLKQVFQVLPDGSFLLDEKIFGRNFSFRRIEKSLQALLGFARRPPGSELRQEHKDLAASLQALLNEAVVALARCARELTGEKNLCLAGGVAMNCVGNSEILRLSGFEGIFIQPAAGDSGGALGAAYYVWNQIQKNPRSFVQTHCFWGPEFGNEQIRAFLDANKVEYEYFENAILYERAARLIAEQKIVGWFRGRMEWGERALGNRSILADARNRENLHKLNAAIKFREDFRPFAPAVVAEQSQDFFDLPVPSPFMLFTAKVKTDQIPAATHVDGTARLQTVDSGTNPDFYALLQEFGRQTGCPVLVNTSFNIRGEPIVCTPSDALDSFRRSGLDVLVLGNYIVKKQPTTVNQQQITNDQLYGKV